VILPRVTKELNLELVRPDAIRADEGTPGSIRTLERHQMLILFLTKEANDGYASWNRFQALYPVSVDRGEVQTVEKTRYYRLVLPLEPTKPAISSHPLTWTTISHVVWDGMPPDTLNPSQQQAMLDWLHWGGQLILVGGAGPSFSLLKDSFLAPYLPADTTGENALLTRDDLAPLSAEYPPPYHSFARDDEGNAEIYSPEPPVRNGPRYRGPTPIRPKADRPVFLSGLTPKPGAIGIPLGEGSGRLVGVEWRMGRGRVLMLALDPTDPALAAWPGLDTFVRRVVLRRPEEGRPGPPVWNGRKQNTAVNMLPGADLSWVRYVSRDLGAVLARPPAPPPKLAIGPRLEKKAKPTFDQSLPAPEDEDSQMVALDAPVAEWVDTSGLPRFSRASLEHASGIKIPSSTFVLEVIVGYILLLVPLNWLICRHLLRRKELAWVAVPVLALGFAVGVERLAAYDMGYNSACDEIDVLELFAGYTRAHVSRFASLYSTGRTRYAISFPNNPSALALPLDNGRSLRGEDVSTTIWQSYPIPALEGYLVQPRSLAMYRAEEMATLDGTINLETDEGTRKIVNGTSLELRDAVLVDTGGPDDKVETYLGTIGPGAVVDVKAAERAAPPSDDVFRREVLLGALRDYYEDRPENKGELRLVAWIEGPAGGQKIEPVVDRHRGFTAVVAHLAMGPPPVADTPTYDAHAKGAPAAPKPAVDARYEQTITRRGGMVVPPQSKLRRPALGSAPASGGGSTAPLPK
jgi:hypothetical protein